MLLLLLLWFQMHVAELLVSHGASLNAKTFLEETPIGIFTPKHSLINATSDVNSQYEILVTLLKRI